MNKVDQIAGWRDAVKQIINEDQQPKQVIKKPYLHQLVENETLYTNVQTDSDFAEVGDVLKSKGIQYAWSAEQGVLIFNNMQDKRKAMQILGKKWIAQSEIK